MKKSFVYIIAGVLAIVAGFSLWTMFQKQNQPEPEEAITPVVQTPMPIEMTNIVVARQRIEAGTEITSSMLELTPIPLSERPLYAVTNTNELLGTTAILNIEQGDAVLSIMVEQPHVYIADSQGLAYEVPEGFVAYAIPVQGLSGLAGYLQPGDVVNILAYAKSVKAATEGIVIFDREKYGDYIMPENKAYLLKNVTILAVGDKAYDELMADNALSKEVAKSTTKVITESDENSESATYGGVTYTCLILALDDFSAQLLSEVMETSPLTLTLQHRGFGVHEVTVPQIATVSNNFSYTSEADERAIITTP